MESRESTRGLTLRSLFVALVVMLIWTVSCCFMVAAGGMRTQHLLMVLGFGAILTIFLLQYPPIFLASIVLIYVGTGALMLAGATADEHAAMRTGLLRSLWVLVPMMALAGWLWRRPLRKGELVVVYAAVLIGIPWTICLRAVIESSAANLFESQRESEPQLYAWARNLPWWAPSVRHPPMSLEGKSPAPPPMVGVAGLATPAGAADAALRTAGWTLDRTDFQAIRDETLTRKAIEGFAKGNGGHVPWKLWARPIAYWTGMCLAWQGMLMGLLLMFRKRFIEHQRLPFVWSQPAIELIRGPPAATRRPRSHWVLFALGLAICLPSVIFMSPQGESLTSWGCPPWAGDGGMEGIRAGVDLTSLNLLPNTQLRLWWGPLVLTLFLLFPVDVLMTTAVTYVLLSILLPGLMRAFGIAVGPTLLAVFVKNGLRFGGGLGLLFWGIFYNRRTIWGYLRSLWGGAPADEASRDELGRVKVFLTFLVGLVAFVALGCHATSLLQMSLLTLLVLIYSFSQMRLRIEGLPLTYDNNYGSHQMVGIQRDILGTHYNVTTETANPDMAAAGEGWAIHWFQWGFNGQMKSLGPHNMLLEAFKIGHELKVHARDIAKVILITMVITAAVTPALFIHVMHVYGFENNFTGQLTTWADFMQWSERSASYGIHSTSAVIYKGAATWYGKYKYGFHILYGVLIIGALFHLRREYPRFPFSPVGVVIAAEYWTPGKGMPFSADQVWFSFLLIWVAKSLIFRWLGVRSFRERIVPGAIMLLCGMIFGMMVYIFRHIALLSGCMK